MEEAVNFDTASLHGKGCGSDSRHVVQPCIEVEC